MGPITSPSSLVLGIQQQKKLFGMYWNIDNKYTNKMHMEMFLSHSKIEWIFMSWIRKDYLLYILLCDLKDVVIIKVTHLFVVVGFFAIL